MRGCLKKLGFHIIERAQNVDGPIGKRTMAAAIHDAAQRSLIPSGDGESPCIVFYFAGHGIAVGTRNYLLGGQFDPSDPLSLSFDALDLERDVATALATRSDVQSVLLIDACRSEQHGGQSFVEPSFIPGRTLFCFATMPGALAADGRDDGQSPYSKALVQHLPTPDQSILDTLHAVSEAVIEDTKGGQRPTFNHYGVQLRLADRGGESGPTQALEPLPRRSYTDAEVARMAYNVHRLRAKDSTGQPACYFVLVEPELDASFLRATQGSGVVDLEHFGVVLASCYGTEPTEEVRAYLRERYGFVADRLSVTDVQLGG